MGMRERRGVFARRHQPGEMRHVDMQICPHHVGNLAHPGKIDHPRDRRAAGDDDFRLMFAGQRLDLVIIEQVVLLAHAVLHRMEPLARLVRARAVGQVAASRQRHAQNGVAGFDQRLKHALIGL